MVGMLPLAFRISVVVLALGSLLGLGLALALFPRAVRAALLRQLDKRGLMSWLQRPFRGFYESAGYLWYLRAFGLIVLCILVFIVRNLAAGGR